MDDVQKMERMEVFVGLNKLNFRQESFRKAK